MGEEGWLGSSSVNLYSLEKMSRDCAGRKKRKQESPLSLPPIANNHPPPASRYHHHPTSSLLPSSPAHTHTHTQRHRHPAGIQTPAAEPSAATVTPAVPHPAPCPGRAPPRLGPAPRHITSSRDKPRCSHWDGHSGVTGDREEPCHLASQLFLLEPVVLRRPCSNTPPTRLPLPGRTTQHQPPGAIWNSHTLILTIIIT